MLRRCSLGPFLVLTLALACSSEQGANKPSAAGGSANAQGGSAGLGAGSAQGGATPASGGAPSLGGAGSGGAGTNGGSAGSGNGGASATGGSGSGGANATGGSGSGGAAGGGNTAGHAGTAGSAGSSWHAPVSSQVTDQMLNDGYAAWKTKYTQTCSNGSAVVVKDNDVVSEGIAYGMLLSAAMNDRTLFDGLNKYYGDHLDSNGLMNWRTSVCENPGNNNSNAATDGDLDAAMALVQANARWQGGGYLEKARALAAKILEFEVEDCSGRKVLRPGDKFGGCSDAGNARINPSYFAPGYYRVFAHHFTDQASTWNALVDGTYELFPVMQARINGLVPDWSKPDGSDWNGAKYSWDACRTPWRVMVDYGFSGDAKAKTFLQNLRAWADANTPGVDQANSAFLGGYALAAAYDKTKFEAAMTSWLTAQMDDKPYFQATLRLLYLLAAAGKFPSTL